MYVMHLCNVATQLLRKTTVVILAAMYKVVLKRIRQFITSLFLCVNKITWGEWGEMAPNLKK